MKLGFTLIELLIVIALIATLGAVVTLVLNPAELIKQSRDSVRLNDLGVLNRAISLYQTQRPNDPLELGNPNTVYVSLPDTDGIFGCDEYSLPLLPLPWSYVCRSEADLRNVDNSGWIPINFTLLDSNNPLSRLPVDPINTNVDGFYYTYVPGGSWKLTAIFESEKLAKFMAVDGGPDPSIFEIGNDLNLANFARGLVAYWKFDEGSGTSVIDSSLSGNNASLTLLNSYPQWELSDCKIGSCIRNGDNPDDQTTSPYIASIQNIINPANSDLTAMAWVKLVSSSIPPSGQIIFKGKDSLSWLYRESSNNPSINRLLCSRINGYICSSSKIPPLPATWRHAAVTYNKSSQTSKLYLNGIAETIGMGAAFNSNDILGIGADSAPHDLTSQEWWGLIDEARIYNRALSASEIKALYNATK